MANHDWTTPKSDVTDQLVYEVGKVIIKGIQNSPNRIWTATIPAIQKALGNTDEEEYGTYLQATGMACRRYKIQWDKAGSSGRHYTMNPTDMAAFIANEAALSGEYITTVQVTMTCPCCNTPTIYDVIIKPHRAE